MLLKMSISNAFPGDAAAAGLGTRLREPLCWSTYIFEDSSYIGVFQTFLKIHPFSVYCTRHPWMLREMDKFALW